MSNYFFLTCCMKLRVSKGSNDRAKFFKKKIASSVFAFFSPFFECFEYLKISSDLRTSKFNKFSCWQYIKGRPLFSLILRERDQSGPSSPNIFKYGYVLVQGGAESTPKMFLNFKIQKRNWDWKLEAGSIDILVWSPYIWSVVRCWFQTAFFRAVSFFQ